MIRPIGSVRGSALLPRKSSRELLSRPAHQPARKGVLLPIALACVSLLVGGAGLTSAVAVVAWVTNGPPTNEELTQTVRAKDGRSEIQVPEDWHDHLLAQREEGAIEVGPCHREMLVRVNTEPKTILGQTMNRDEYARLVSDDVRRQARGMPTVVGPTAMTVNGRSAIRYEITGRGEAASKVILLTVIEGEGHFHQVIASSKARGAERHRALLESVTASFRETR